MRGSDTFSTDTELRPVQQTAFIGSLPFRRSMRGSQAERSASRVARCAEPRGIGRDGPFTNGPYRLTSQRANRVGLAGRPVAGLRRLAPTALRPATGAGRLRLRRLRTWLQAGVGLDDLARLHHLFERAQVGAHLLLRLPPEEFRNR